MRKLGEILVQEGLVGPQQVDRALLWQRDDGGRIGSLLIRLGYLEEREFLRLMAAQLRTRPVLIAEARLDSELLKLVPAEIAWQASAIPVAYHGDHLIVATSDPHNLPALREIEAATGHAVEAWLAADPAVASALERHYPRGVRPESAGTPTLPIRVRPLREVDPHASLEPLIHGWIDQALGSGAAMLVIQMTPGGLKVRCETADGGFVLAEPHASLYRELIRKLRQSAALRPPAGPSRRESGVLPHVRDGQRLRLGLTLVPDVYGCSARLSLSEARGLLLELARSRGRAAQVEHLERLAS